jgi:hypothetical protein
MKKMHRNPVINVKDAANEFSQNPDIYLFIFLVKELNVNKSKIISEHIFFITYKIQAVQVLVVYSRIHCFVTY